MPRGVVGASMNRKGAYFFGATADDEPITVLADKELETCLVVVGGDRKAWSGSMPVNQAFLYLSEVCLFDLSEEWALRLAVKEESNPGRVRQKAAEMLQ